MSKRRLRRALVVAVENKESLLEEVSKKLKGKTFHTVSVDHHIDPLEFLLLMEKVAIGTPFLTPIEIFVIAPYSLISYLDKALFGFYPSSLYLRNASYYYYDPYRKKFIKLFSRVSSHEKEMLKRIVPTFYRRNALYVTNGAWWLKPFNVSRAFAVPTIEVIKSVPYLRYSMAFRKEKNEI